MGILRPPRSFLGVKNRAGGRGHSALVRRRRRRQGKFFPPPTARNKVKNFKNIFSQTNIF